MSPRKERSRICNRIGNRIRNNFYILINQNVSELQIILMSLSFKAEKKGKKAKKKREDNLQRDKKTENSVILEFMTYLDETSKKVAVVKLIFNCTTGSPS